jgi:integrase
LIQDWRTQYIKKAEGNPLARQSAIRSANSYIRCARSLFSKKWLARLKLRLPSPLPFEGVKVERNRAPRYASTIDPKKLFETAQKELAAVDPQAYVIFLLALGAGLRKAEIDGLEWSHINFDRGVIRVEPTEFRDVKTESSVAEVEVDASLMEQLQQHKTKAQSQFVIESDGVSRPGLDRQHYRADVVFKQLYAWLRNQGVKSEKPLHTLRKEFGSLINSHFGLYAAMTALRHSDIKTTSSHYTDNKRRIALPMNKILNATKTA